MPEIRKKISKFSKADLIRLQWLLVQFGVANASTISLNEDYGKANYIRIYRHKNPFAHNHFNKLGSILNSYPVSNDGTDYVIDECDLGRLQAADYTVKPIPDSKKEQKTDENVRAMQERYNEFKNCLEGLLRSLVIPYVDRENKQDDQELRTGANVYISILPVQLKNKKPKDKKSEYKVINCLKLTYEKAPRPKNSSIHRSRIRRPSLFNKFVSRILSESNRERYTVPDLKTFLESISSGLDVLHSFNDPGPRGVALNRQRLAYLLNLVKQIDLEYIEDDYMDHSSTRIFTIDQYVITVSSEFLAIKHNGKLLHHSPFACSKWAQDSDDRTKAPKVLQPPLDLSKAPVTWVCALLSEALTQQCKNSAADSLVSQLKAKVDELLKESLQSSPSTSMVTQSLNSETGQSWIMDAADEKKSVAGNMQSTVASTPETNQCTVSTESIFKPEKPADSLNLNGHASASADKIKAVSDNNSLPSDKMLPAVVSTSETNQCTVSTESIFKPEKPADSLNLNWHANASAELPDVIDLSKMRLCTIL